MYSSPGDLWQRLARTGARFAAVPDVLAYYHVRVTSRSFDAWQLLRDGLVVVERGHGADPRLPDAPMPMAAGVPAAQAPAAKLFLVTWCAGLVIGRGEDARPLLAAAGPELEITKLPAVAGEVILVHNHLWHRSGRTATGKPRRALSVIARRSARWSSCRRWSRCSSRGCAGWAAARPSPGRCSAWAAD